MKQTVALSALVLPLFLWSCGGDDTPTAPTPRPTPVATSITLSVTSLSLASLGATSQISATVKDQNGGTMSGATVTWATSDAAVATVSSSGLVTSIADGTATITATSGSATGTAAVTVAQEPATLELSRDSVTFGVIGDTLTLTATVTDAGGSSMAEVTVDWSSSDTGVVTVSSTGFVTAVADGSATITATSGSATATVSVTVSRLVYPAVIRGLWEPGAWDQLATFVSNQAGVDRLKSLGINTISVLASFDVLDNGEYRFQPGRLEMAKEDIVRYKRLGFAVLLSGNGYGVPKDADPQARLDNYLQSCRAAAIELAELAEEYQVEYFSPANEFEGSFAQDSFPAFLQSPNPPETAFDPPDAGTDARVELASEWFRDLLPAVRPLFSGRLIAKIGGAHSGYRVNGYDYLGFTIDHHYLDQTDFRRLIKLQYGQIAEAASASNVPWMVGEAYFHHSEPSLDLDQETMDFLEGMQEHYFDISLDEYMNFNGSPSPCGYVFIGYFMDGIEVKDSPSEAVIEGYFDNMVTSDNACSPS